MRILMIAATPYFADRGCHVRIRGQAEALRRLEVAVTIATYGLGRDLPGDDLARTWGLPGYRRLDAAPSVGKLALDALLVPTAIRAARRTRPDLIHAHTQEGGLIGLVVGRLLNLPVVVDLQSRRVAEELVHYGRSRPGGALYRVADWFDRAIPTRAAAVVASTTEIADFVRAEAPPAGPVELLADAVDVPTELEPADPALARELGLDPHRPVIVYLGLLSESQGVDLLLAAVHHLHQAGVPAQLLAMGYPDVDLWRRRAADSGIGDAVRFTGRLPFERAAQYLRLGDVAVSAKRSTTEGNGKLLLYMACGLATVALDTSVNRAILGPDGVYAEDSPASFAERIRELLEDAPEAERRGRALNRAVRTESWDARARQLLALYQQVQRRQVDPCGSPDPCN